MDRDRLANPKKNVNLNLPLVAVPDAQLGVYVLSRPGRDRALFIAQLQVSARFYVIRKPKNKTPPKVGFCLVVGPVGIEPTTHGLKVRCSNQLS